MINLAVADILKVMINLPLNIVSSYYATWMFGQFGKLILLLCWVLINIKYWLSRFYKGCDVYGFAGGLFGFISVSTLALMSIERYLVVTFPLRMLHFSKNLKICNDFTNFVLSKFKFNFKFFCLNKVCVVSTWIYSLIWSSLQLFSVNRFVLEGLLTSCSFDYLSRDFKSRFLIITMFIGGFLIPFITINIFYILTNHSLKSRNKFFRYQVRTSIIKKGLVAEDNLLLNESVKTKKKESSSNDLESIPDTTVVKLFRIKELMRLESNKLSTSSNDAQFFNLLIKREKKLVRTIILNIALFCIAWVNTIYLFFNKFEHNISFFCYKGTLRNCHAFISIRQQYRILHNSLYNIYTSHFS